jgi:aspartate aminotransferase-like enzyme
MLAKEAGTRKCVEPGLLEFSAPEFEAKGGDAVVIDETLTMIPGPTPVRERILRALARPTTSHQDPSFVQTFRECLANLNGIALTESAQPFLVSGSGTLAMEMALVNLLGSGDRLLVLSQGYFGDRWDQLAGSFGLESETLRAEWGRAVPAEELERRLASGSHAAVAVTHVDTSTGAAAPVERYAELLRDRDELFILDGVCATAGMEERFDAWGLDVLVTGAQKALGAPPGVAVLLASERAMEKRRARGAVPAYYADWLRWLPVMEDPSRYFSTPPVNEVVSLHEATRLVLEEGLERRFRRHASIARAVRAGLEAMGLELFTDADCRADTLSVVRYPKDVDDAAFRSEVAALGVVVAGALGPIAGRAFRLGHMGNIGAAEVERALGSIESGLARVGHALHPGAAVAAAKPHFDF